MMSVEPQAAPRDRVAAKSASRAAALVVAVLAMVVEIAPAVFLIAGGGSLAAVLANAPLEGVERTTADRPSRSTSARDLVAPSRRPARIAATAPDARPPADGRAAFARRLDLPPPAAA